MVGITQLDDIEIHIHHKPLKQTWGDLSELEKWQDTDEKMALHFAIWTLIKKNSLWDLICYHFSSQLINANSLQTWAVFSQKRRAFTNHSMFTENRCDKGSQVCQNAFILF